MQGGAVFHDAPLKLVIRNRNHYGTNSRLGIAVSKKYSKSAVDRNYAKRLLREYFRKSNLKLNGIDILAILAKPAQCTAKKDVSDLIYSKFKNLEGRIIWAQTKKEH